MVLLSLLFKARKVTNAQLSLPLLLLPRQDRESTFAKHIILDLVDLLHKLTSSSVHIFDDKGLLVILAAFLKATQVEELINKDLLGKAPFRSQLLLLIE